MTEAAVIAFLGGPVAGLLVRWAFKGWRWCRRWRAVVWTGDRYFRRSYVHVGVRRGFGEGLSVSTFTPEAVDSEAFAEALAAAKAKASALNAAQRSVRG